MSNVLAAIAKQKEPININEPDKFNKKCKHYT